MLRLISDWSVDVGHGPQPVRVPHCFGPHSDGLDVDVRWEGPAIYETVVRAPDTGGWLLFHGVSYAARVFVEGKEAAFHEGIWDAFPVPLGRFAGQDVAIRVEVLKNGGATYPVRSVLSGFLPYVFNTFGGIFREVEFLPGAVDPLALTPRKPERSRVEARGSKLYLDGAPFYLRGVLSWGWYPGLGFPNPDEETIRRELQAVKLLGYNCIKFCLWCPPHRYFKMLREAGMVAWLELPLWDPRPECVPRFEEELTRIVRQYAHHPEIVVWTVGCELSRATPPEFRERMTRMVQHLTGCPLVKDNSGGAEMYGGDLREFGTFDDFHPYAEPTFYPLVLDSLRQGPRMKRPLLLGETNDHDDARDLARIQRDAPYWASSDPAKNDQGVRWQYDLPRILRDSRFAQPNDDGLAEQLRSQSRRRSTWVRRRMMAEVLARDDISGFVTTGLADTPISSSGVLNDWGEPKWTDPCYPEASVFFIPSRRPPWIGGGNRPGWSSRTCFFQGEMFLRVGLASNGFQGEVTLRVLAEQPSRSFEVLLRHVVDAPPLNAVELFTQAFPNAGPGRYTYSFELDGVEAGRGCLIVERLYDPDSDRFHLYDPLGLLAGLSSTEEAPMLATALPPNWREWCLSGRPLLLLLTGEGTIREPFWRECALLENSPLGLADWDAQEQLFDIAPDCALDPGWLDTLGLDFSTRLLRIDTRSYKEHPYWVGANVGEGKIEITSLRPFGGLGIQPLGVTNNPFGLRFLRELNQQTAGRGVKQFC